MCIRGVKKEPRGPGRRVSTARPKGAMMAEKSHAVNQIINGGLKFDLRAVRVRVKVRVGIRVRFRVGELASGTFQSSFYLHGRATA